MAFNESFDVTNPAELAQPFAVDLVYKNSFNELRPDEDEIYVLNVLGRAVKTLGLKGDYLVEAGRVFAIPEYHNPEMLTDVVNVPSVTFEAEFQEHTIVKFDGLEDGSIIRALCLAFKKITLLPTFDRVSNERLFCVPVFAVEDILRTG